MHKLIAVRAVTWAKRKIIGSNPKLGIFWQKIGIIRLIHDNYHEFKPRNKKIKFNNNIIRHVSEKIKELQKDKKFDEIRTMIHRIKIDNWKQFLEELVKLKVNNNIKEYFLRMKFYTDIGRNVSILNNLKI